MPSSSFRGGPRRGRIVRLRTVVIVLVVTLFAVPIIYRFRGPQNPELYFTPSRQTTLTQMSEALLANTDYEMLVARRPFAFCEVKVETDGTLSEDQRKDAVSFIRRTRMTRVTVDRRENTVLWIHVFCRRAFCYKYSPLGTPTNLHRDARFVEPMGSNWVFFVF